MTGMQWIRDTLTADTQAQAHLAGADLGQAGAFLDGWLRRLLWTVPYEEADQNFDLLGDLIERPDLRADVTAALLGDAR